MPRWTSDEDVDSLADDKNLYMLYIRERSGCCGKLWNAVCLTETDFFLVKNTRNTATKSWCLRLIQRIDDSKEWSIIAHQERKPLRIELCEVIPLSSRRAFSIMDTPPTEIISSRFAPLPIGRYFKNIGLMCSCHTPFSKFSTKPSQVSIVLKDLMIRPSSVFLH